MYHAFTVRQFRCFDTLAVTDLKRINLITGKNTVGKTALLEALWLHGGAYTPELMQRVDAFRGLAPQTTEAGSPQGKPWSLLFYNFDDARTIELVGEDDRLGASKVELNVLVSPGDQEELDKLPLMTRDLTDWPGLSAEQWLRFRREDANGRDATYYLRSGLSGGIGPSPFLSAAPFPMIFLTSGGRAPLQEDAARFGELVRAKSQDWLLAALQRLEPQLKSLALVPIGGQALLYGDIGLKALVPLSRLGSGVNRLASLLLAIWTAREGIVLIDAIEDGLHHSVLSAAWQAIYEATTRFSAQIFATTQSWECIGAAQDILGATPSDDFRLHRLERSDEHIHVVTYSREILAAALEADLEVR